MTAFEPSAGYLQPDVGSIKDIVEELYPLHRTLASDGTDRALEIVGERLPAEASWTVDNYPPGEAAWTWTIPERYVVHEAYLETADGERVADFAEHALHLVSYSEPVDTVLSFEELEPHLHFSEARPTAIPFEFKYYERDWGFCLSKERFDSLRRDARYRAVIRAEFVTDPGRGLRTGVATLGDGSAGEILLCAHVCHPSQANDDASGVATAIEVARRLAADPLPDGSLGVRLLFCPETIGSIAYLSHHEDVIPGLRAAVFLEMTGNRNRLALQRSRQDDHRLDRVARGVVSAISADFEEGAFREIVGNDEMVINGPGVDVPCVSLSRWPYPEYHTSDDVPAIVQEEMLVEAADAVERIVRIYATDYVPRRTFRGPVFLSGHGLWVDWREDMALNRALEQIMVRLEGELSVFDIAHEVGLDYWQVRSYLERFRAAGLVERVTVEEPVLP